MLNGHAADENAADECATDESASQKGPQAEPEAEVEEAAGRAVGGKSLEELAVRFSQATKELQASACASFASDIVVFSAFLSCFLVMD